MVDKNKSIKVVEETLKGKSNFFIKDKESFNKSIDHIVQLIKDSYLLYVNKSYPSSSFLSLAVIEEVSKVHIGIYIKPSKEYVKKDKLRDHMTKEIIGFNYTISMGKRLINAMDEEEIEEIFELVYSGEMKNLEKIQYTVS